MRKILEALIDKAREGLYMTEPRIKCEGTCGEEFENDLKGTVNYSIKKVRCPNCGGTMKEFK